MLSSAAAAAAAIAAGTVLAADLYTPDLWPLFQILPSQLFRKRHFELVVQRSRVVVAGKLEHRAGGQCVDDGENPGVALHPGNGPDIDDRDGSGFGSCHVVVPSGRDRKTGRAAVLPKRLTLMRGQGRQFAETQTIPEHHIGLGFRKEGGQSRS